MKRKDWIEKMQADKRLSHLLQSIPKKNKQSQVDFLHVLSRLAYLLYLTDEIELALYIAEKMLTLEFEGDYRYWEPVQNVGLLAAYVDKERYEQEVREKMDQVRNDGDEDLVFGKNKVHKRFLKGQRLTVLKAELAQVADEQKQMNKRLIFLFHLFYLHLFVADLEMDKQELKQEISENLSILRNYIARNGYSELYPFHSL